MAAEPKPTPPDLFPLPAGIKLRTRKFGANPLALHASALAGVCKGDPSAPREEFEIRWEDQKQGLTVIVRNRDDGRLIADVFAIDAALLNKAWVSVSLVGKAEHDSERKTIPLDVAEKNGCSGSAEFGPLVDVVNRLGPEIGLVVFLLV
jgi:hypothetical protein